MALKLNLPLRTGEVLTRRMVELKVSKRTLAHAVGASYEYVRRVVGGQSVPSKSMVHDLATALKIREDELQRIVTADRIRLKFGTIPLELAGKNPELEPLEMVWSHLSQDHKADLIAQAQAWAKRDRETAKKH